MTDEQLLREALEALVDSAIDAHSFGCKPEGERLFKHCSYQACVRARAVIAKLEERLLQE